MSPKYAFAGPLTRMRTLLPDIIGCLRSIRSEVMGAVDANSHAPLLHLHAFFIWPDAKTTHCS